MYTTAKQGTTLQNLNTHLNTRPELAQSFRNLLNNFFGAVFSVELNNLWSEVVYIYYLFWW